MKKVILKRDVTINECDWLDRDLNKGESFYKYNGCTYGCISQYGIAVTEKPNKTPFFEIPIDALI